MTRPREGGSPRRPGFSLVEIVVALIVLELGLLAVVGLSVLAARTLAEAAELQRATGALEVVVDSLLEAGSWSPGERSLPPHRVRWWRETGQLRVRVERLDGDGLPGVEVRLPLGDA
ncbi:MAG: hypothetical protein PVI57_19490 [Gemmatimonadota bacterium]